MVFAVRIMFVWRSWCVLDQSQPDSEPDAPPSFGNYQQFNFPQADTSEPPKVMLHGIGERIMVRPVLMLFIISFILNWVKWTTAMGNLKRMLMWIARTSASQCTTKVPLGSWIDSGLIWFSPTQNFQSIFVDKIPLGFSKNPPKVVILTNICKSIYENKN